MSEYRLSRRAADDLLAIWQRIAADSRRNADCLLARMERSFRFLAAHPVNGDVWRLGPTEVRYYAVPRSRYVVFFVPAATGVDIRRVIYGGADLDTVRVD
jgi:plasmid stabilization system protein ParE